MCKSSIAGDTVHKPLGSKSQLLQVTIKTDFFKLLDICWTEQLFYVNKACVTQRGGGGIFMSGRAVLVVIRILFTKTWI